MTNSNPIPKTITCHPTREQEQVIRALVDTGIATSRTDAVRQLVDAGMAATKDTLEKALETHQRIQELQQETQHPTDPARP